MCLIESTCEECKRGEHERCDGWAVSYAPGNCKGFPSHVPCDCASASARYQSYSAASGLKLPEHPQARTLLGVTA